MANEAEAVDQTEAVDDRDQLINELKSQLKETNQKLVDSNEEAMRRRKTVEKWKELGESPDAVREMLNNKPADNNNEEIINQIKQQYESKLSESQQRLQSYQQKNAMAELKSALAGENIIPEGLDPITLMAQQRIAFDETGNSRIMNADGTKPLAGSGADGYATVADLAKELAASKMGQLFVRDNGLSGGGKPPASQQGNPQSKTVTRSQWDTMTQRDRATFVKDGGKVRD
jgi:DNA-binding transcriptional MerR regulator